LAVAHLVGEAALRRCPVYLDSLVEGVLVVDAFGIGTDVPAADL
jgi:hypothetical protein